MGNLIAIVGQGLGGAREIWFNDQEAELEPAYVTDRTILVSLPSLPPEVVDNLMKITFADGSTLTHRFSVSIPEPQVANMTSEYVAVGDVATINGNFFFEPITVTFAGGVTAEVVSIEPSVLRVEVPEGAEPGPVTVTTNFGSTQSDFWYWDTRNIFGDFEGEGGGWWHGHDKIVSSDPDILPIDGKFLRVNQALAEDQWFEFFVGVPVEDMGQMTANIPDDAIANPERYWLKFELNTLESLAGSEMHIYIGNDMPGRRIDDGVAWNPLINTQSTWQTIYLPFDQVIALSKPSADPNGYGISFWFWHGGALTVNFGADNFRVVPRSLNN